MLKKYIQCILDIPPAPAHQQDGQQSHHANDVRAYHDEVAVEPVYQHPSHWPGDEKGQHMGVAGADYGH
jgi:hypothetical protein